MSDPTADLLPEGLEDRLPIAARALTRARRAALDAMDAHGYDRVIPPLVEFEKSLATRMSGLATRKQFRFVDPKSLRTLALRSDITVQVGRIAATSLANAPRPLRLCYAGEVAVIAADQLDPARQRLQLGAELIGSDGAPAAAEIVALAIAALEAAGASGISVDFTLPDLVDTLAQKALPLPADRIEAVRGRLDAKDAGGLREAGGEGRGRLDAKDAGGLREAGGEAYLPLLYSAGPFDRAVERLGAIDAGGVLASRIAGLRDIAARVGARARLTLDPTERHGFEYQSWFGFTLYADGVRGTLGRGGTYRIGGTQEPATGFSLYIDPLVDARGQAEPRDTLYLPPDHDVGAAARLRAIGWRTIAALDEGEDARSLGCTHRLEGSETVRL